MILEGADGAFGCVATAKMRRGKLEVDRLLVQKIAEQDGSFVVKSLKEGTEASRSKKFVRPLVSSNDFGSSSVLHGFDVDEVAVGIVEDEHVVVAGYGRD